MMKRFAILAALTLTAFSLHAEEKKEEKPSSHTITLEVQAPEKPVDEALDVRKKVDLTKLMATAVKSTEERLIAAGCTDYKIVIHGNQLFINIEKTTPSTAQSLATLLSTSGKLSLHKRHPQHSPAMAKQVFDKEVIIPGAAAYPYEQWDFKTDKPFTTYVLVERKAQIDNGDIEQAHPNHATNTEIVITLTNSGTKKMEAFTKSLKRGQEHIVSILDGKVMNDAVLNADYLSKMFVISGLDNIKECEQLSKAFNTPLTHEVKIVEIKSVTP